MITAFGRRMGEVASTAGQADLVHHLGDVCHPRQPPSHAAFSVPDPEPRAVQPPGMGDLVELPEVGGLHHRYERRAA